MPTTLQFRRGTTAQNNAFTGSAGELSVDTQLNTLRVHDGSTAGGATIGGITATSDTSTNAERLIYVGSVTSGALTAVTQDSGLTYNPSTGSLTSATFIGALTGNASGSAATLATPRAIALTGAVTGTANFDGSAGISISTTATSDPTITLAGDLSGSVTLTNLGDATLTATIAANSVALSTDTTGNYVAAGATSGSGISGSVSSEGGTFTVTSNATNANTGSTIVFRDASGNFSAGTITATATQAQYADLAEKYTSDQDYEPGTVVELGGTAEVTQTRRPSSVAIAGIVSTDPAYLMNKDLEGISVALVGRVPCKVTGIIKKGDLLVSSDIPGHAKAHRDLHGPQAGSMIGKAIENKDDDGTGVIEVLVGRM